MKVITVRQPWAYFLCAGIKTIETRSFNTKHRGPLLIHASNHVPTKEEVKKYETDPAFAVHRQHSLSLFGPEIKRGAIIGKVDIIDTKPAEDWREFFDNIIGFGAPLKCGQSDNMPVITKREAALGDYSAGRYGWLTSHARLFTKPIPAKGALSMWNTWNKHALSVNASTLLYYGEFLEVYKKPFQAEWAMKEVFRYLNAADLAYHYPEISRRARIIEDKLFPTFKY